MGVFMNTDITNKIIPSNRILVFDTTLRDGEQVPGAKLELSQKVKIARQLKRLNVDIIEAGFASSSPGDFNAIKAVAKEVGDQVMITALARAVKSDIDAVYNSVKYAERGMIHIVLGASDIHVSGKFNKSRDEIITMGVDAVKYAKTLMSEVQYSTEDASRADFEYLWKTIEAVIKAGATMINVPDTVGYAVPEEFGELIKKINYRMKNVNEKVILSVHCHNDTGLAVANTLAAVKNGATKVECTMNGIGERAGNAALEEIVMGIKLREDYYHAYTGINTKEIKRTSELVSNLMGLEIQVNKAITGENAFAHSSGIHQDGLLKSRNVYEVISPEDVGVDDMKLILTARSGKHAVKDAFEKLGYDNFKEEEFAKIFEKFLELADIKKEVYNYDLYYILESLNDEIEFKHSNIGDSLYQLVDLQVISNESFPSANVKIRRGQENINESAGGNGAIDALYTAIKSAVNMEVELLQYKTSSISKGRDALGKVSVELNFNNKKYLGKAIDSDIIKASANAFINAINNIIMEQINI